MRVAVLADIHGNLPAAEAVLEDIKRQSPDFICAAGDLALRGPYPRETVQFLSEECDSLLMGNTDCYVAGNYLGGAYREPEHWKSELLAWTRNELGPELSAMLGQLPFSTRFGDRVGQELYVCHANPRNLEDSIEPTLDDHQLRRFLGHLDAAAVAFGHLHFPYRRRVGRMVIADVASAGIPRDGDLRPAWGLFTFTPRGWRVQIRRVRYPVRKATQALTDRKVPGAPLLIHKMLECRYRHHAHLLEAARRHSGLPPYLKPPPGAPESIRASDALTRPPLAVPPGLMLPPPGESTQADEYADELMPVEPLPAAAYAAEMADTDLPPASTGSGIFNPSTPAPAASSGLVIEEMVLEMAETDPPSFSSGSGIFNPKTPLPVHGQQLVVEESGRASQEVDDESDDA